MTEEIKKVNGCTFDWVSGVMMMVQTTCNWIPIGINVSNLFKHLLEMNFYIFVCSFATKFIYDDDPRRVQQKFDLELKQKS